MAVGVSEDNESFLRNLIRLLSLGRGGAADGRVRGAMGVVKVVGDRFPRTTLVVATALYLLMALSIGVMILAAISGDDVPP